MKRVLIGTTNPSKVKRFRELLSGYGVEFLTLSDLNITGEPEETGNTPEENAIVKATYYGQYFDAVICNDSGLYFESLSPEDPRQPGLHIRTPRGKRLDDEEMIAYYSDLIRSLGGRVQAYYLDGIAVYRDGAVSSFMDRSVARQSSFPMVDIPSKQRHPGWPLDSLSLNRNGDSYFTEGKKLTPGTVEENVLLGEYRERLTDFLVRALRLEREEVTSETSVLP